MCGGLPLLPVLPLSIHLETPLSPIYEILSPRQAAQTPFCLSVLIPVRLFPFVFATLDHVRGNGASKSLFYVAFTELQRGSGGRAQAEVQLYDTPYEDERGQRLVYGEVHEEGKEGSKLPQDDERPADEYDQPWEWKKDHISKAFAGNSKSTQPTGQRGSVVTSHLNRALRASLRQGSSQDILSLLRLDDCVD